MQVQQAILDVVHTHGEAITGAVTALCIAGIITMPPKAPLLAADNRLQEVWAWLRDTLQTAVPAARHAPKINP